MTDLRAKMEQRPIGLRDSLWIGTLNILRRIAHKPLYTCTHISFGGFTIPARSEVEITLDPATGDVIIGEPKPLEADERP